MEFQGIDPINARRDAARSAIQVAKTRYRKVRRQSQRCSNDGQHHLCEAREQHEQVGASSFVSGHAEAMALIAGEPDLSIAKQCNPPPSLSQLQLSSPDSPWREAPSPPSAQNHLSPKLIDPFLPLFGRGLVLHGRNEVLQSMV